MIREDPVSATILYTCNDLGVFVSTNGGQTWDVVGGNLPSVQIMDFIVGRGDARARRVGKGRQQDRRRTLAHSLRRSRSVPVSIC
jgi:hypothetical protein